jgi:predicted transcriptional regulator
MNWKLALGNTFRFFLRLIAILAIQRLLRQAGFFEWTARDSGGLNAVIEPVGGIYAVLLAFTVFVIWGQFTEVENQVMGEANSLAALMRFAEFLDADSSARLRRAVSTYAQRALKQEWTALGEGRTDKQAGELFADILRTVVETPTATEAQKEIHGRLLEIAQQTGACRDERVSKSLTRMPPTLSALVRAVSAALLLLLFVYPFESELIGAACFVLVSIVVFLANFVMADTDNPIQGVWNVSPKPFAVLAKL